MGSDVDPRFDPQFQRGYDRRAELRASTDPAAAVDQSPRTEPTPALVMTPSATERAPAADPVDRLRNPWLTALWIVAGVLTVLGIGAQYLSQSMLQGEFYNSALDFYVVPATVAALSPWFVGAGLFGGVAAVVLSAIRWRPVGE